MKRPPRDALAMSLLLFVVILSVWIGIAGPLANDFWAAPYQWFKDFQPLIGIAVAGLGLYMAWRNVSRQISQGRKRMLIDVMSREEDRMEADLPGLDAANNF